MKKVIILFITGMLLASCTPDYDSSTYNYKVIDTVNINTNNFGNVDSYDFIIKIDSTYFSAHLNKESQRLTLRRKLTNIIEK